MKTLELNGYVTELLGAVRLGGVPITQDRVQAIRRTKCCGRRARTHAAERGC
jgi:hypothetical protein